MPTESGYSSEKMFGRVRHKTLQSLGASRIGEPTSQMCLFDLPAGTQVVLTITGVAYNNPKDKKEILITFDVPHSARQWDVVRVLTGSLAGYELEILSAPAVDSVVVHNIFTDEAGGEVLPAIGDTFSALRWVTAKGGVDGGFAVSFLGGATSAKQDEQIGLMKPESKGFATIDDLSPVTGLTYTQLIADTGADEITKVQIMMTSGDPLILAFGAVGFESDKTIITPGGNGPLDLNIPPNTRLSVKNVYTPVGQTGRLFINFLGPI